MSTDLDSQEVLQEMAARYAVIKPVFRGRARRGSPGARHIRLAVSCFRKRGAVPGELTGSNASDGRREDAESAELRENIGVDTPLENSLFERAS